MLMYGTKNKTVLLNMKAGEIISKSPAFIFVWFSLRISFMQKSVEDANKTIFVKC